MLAMAPSGNELLCLSVAWCPMGASPRCSIVPFAIHLGHNAIGHALFANCDLRTTQLGFVCFIMLVSLATGAHHRPSPIRGTH